MDSAAQTAGQRFDIGFKPLDESLDRTLMAWDLVTGEEKGRVVLFGAGSGMPFFSTDTVAAQRALEVGADVLLMSKNGTDGVYDCDPKTNPQARRYDELTYTDFLAQDLKVADATAISLARDNGLPMVFFDLGVRGNIARVVNGEKIGTTDHDS